LCEKRSAELTIAETKAILRGDIDWALSDGRSLVAELYAKIKEGFFPKTIVEYTREAFTFDAGNARVTLDKDIRGGLYSVGFFDSIPLIRAGDEIALLEVKFDQFIPDHIARALRICDRRPSACSKYALCRLYG
jgi:hypothetical protein